MRCLVVEFQVQLTFKSHRTFLTFEWESEILNTKLQLKMILRRLGTYLGLWCFFMCFKTFLRLWCENSVQNGHRYSNPEGEWQLATWDTKCTLAWKNTWQFLHLNGKLLFSLSELSSTTIMTSILLFSDGFSWIFTTVFIFAFGMQFLKKNLWLLWLRISILSFVLLFGNYGIWIVSYFAVISRNQLINKNSGKN